MSRLEELRALYRAPSRGRKEEAWGPASVMAFHAVLYNAWPAIERVLAAVEAWVGRDQASARSDIAACSDLASAYRAFEEGEG